VKREDRLFTHSQSCFTVQIFKFAVSPWTKSNGATTKETEPSRCNHATNIVICRHFCHCFTYNFAFDNIVQRVYQQKMNPLQRAAARSNGLNGYLHVPGATAGTVTGVAPTIGTVQFNSDRNTWVAKVYPNNVVVVVGGQAVAQESFIINSNTKLVAALHRYISCHATNYSIIGSVPRPNMTTIGEAAFYHGKVFKEIVVKEDHKQFFAMTKWTKRRIRPHEFDASFKEGLLVIGAYFLCAGNNPRDFPTRQSGQNQTCNSLIVPNVPNCIMNVAGIPYIKMMVMHMDPDQLFGNGDEDCIEFFLLKNIPNWHKNNQDRIKKGIWSFPMVHRAMAENNTGKVIDIMKGMYFPYAMAVELYQPGFINQGMTASVGPFKWNVERDEIAQYNELLLQRGAVKAVPPVTAPPQPPAGTVPVPSPRKIDFNRLVSP